MKVVLASPLLLPVLFILCACSAPQALARAATVDTLREKVKLEPIDSTVISFGASIGIALPVWYNPQMFNYIGGSVGYVINGRWVASIDVNASGTSVEIPTPSSVQLLGTTNAGLSLHWFAFRDLFLVAVPSYQYMTIRESRAHGADDPLIETRKRFTVGLGVGVRPKKLITLEFRHYPVLNARTYPQSDVKESGLYQLRVGVLVGGIY